MPGGRTWRVVTSLLAVAVLIAMLPTAGARAAVEVRAACRGPANSVQVADELLANRYQLASHPTVTLPADPDWDEDPLRDTNWQFNLHSMRFIWALTTAWAETGDQRYADRAWWLLRDWYADNRVRSAAPSRMSWNDHATAWRAIVYVCAAEVFPNARWLLDAIDLHGRTLADADFYRSDGGNHALNQDVGLLEVGCFRDRSDWMGLASRRLANLVGRSVDPSGVTNEQSIFYELYNYTRYTAAARRLQECGQTVGADFARVGLMPTFLAHATYPDGRYVPLGDTVPNLATAIAGTPAEFAATQGASGPEPTSTSRVYGAGFAFVRTGWGETRPYADETMLTVRFGPAKRFHGHHDGMSLTIYGYGRPIVVDSGQYSIIPSAYRTYFVGRAAHNLVTVDGARQREAATSLRWKRSSSTLFELAMAGTPYVGVTANRRVTFSRSMGYTLVDDRLSATTTRTFRQLWHLREGTSPVISGRRAYTRADRSNVVIYQVVLPSATRIVSGATAPIQGWISYAYGKKVKAPVVEARRSGTSARFLTLLVPFATTRPSVTVTDVDLTASGYRLTVHVGGRSERVVAGATGSSITPLP
ncbi:MAG TPA: heparinase II/III family protein [Candidatus Limnocylindrales bacterium]